MAVKRPVAAYVRVSTEKQELENQRARIRAWAEENGVPIDYWFEDIMSGSEDRRYDFSRLWEMVKKGKVKTVVVAEISRLSRRQRTLIDFLYDCVDRDVTVVSLRENWLTDALQNPVTRPVVVAMLSTLYEIERQMIAERTRDALRRLKSQGKRLGRRPKLSPEEVREMVKLYKEGVPIRRIARHFGVSHTTVYRYLRRRKVI